MVNGFSDRHRPGGVLLCVCRYCSGAVGPSARAAPVWLFSWATSAFRGHGLQALSEGFLLLAPLALLTVGGRRYRGWTTVWDRGATQAAFSVLRVSLLTYPLKGVFGRTWPANFHENNPSLFHDGVYGFHPFHTGVAYSAFPSGHATVAAVATVLWCSYPRYRVLAVLLWLAVTVGLLAMYYHFVGDILTGTLLGVFVAAHVLRFGARAPVKEPENRD